MRTSITWSGGSARRSVVKPRRSVNITVPSRRTPPSRRSSSARCEHLVDDVLGHEAGEQCRARARARRRSISSAPRARRPRESEQRAERIDERDDPAGVERQLRGDREERRRAATAPARAPAAADSRRPRERREQPEQDDQRHVERTPAPLQREARAARCRSRSPGSRRPDISVVRRSSRSAWMSCSDGADGPTTTILSRKNAARHLPAIDARERDRPDRARRARGSRSRPSSPPNSSGSTCRPRRRLDRSDANVSSPSTS